MITKQTIELLKNIRKGTEFEALEEVAQDLQIKIREASRSTKNQWELTKNTLLNEGQIKGIKRFLEEIKYQTDEYNNN